MRKRCSSCLRTKPIAVGHRKWCEKCAGFLKEINGGRDLNREKVRIRQNHQCQNCRKKWKIETRRFDIHHLQGLCGKKSRGYDQPESDDKLLVLCHRCHMARHALDNQLSGVSYKTILVGKRERIEKLLTTRTYDEVGKLLGVSQAAVWQFINRERVSTKIQSV